MFGEGFNDGIFLKHLKKLYSFNAGVAITVKKGKGGDAKNIVIDAIKIPGAFDRKVVVLDNDKPKKRNDWSQTNSKKRKH